MKKAKKVSRPRRLRDLAKTPLQKRIMKENDFSWMRIDRERQPSCRDLVALLEKLVAALPRDRDIRDEVGCRLIELIQNLPPLRADLAQRIRLTLPSRVRRAIGTPRPYTQLDGDWDSIPEFGKKMKVSYICALGFPQFPGMEPFNEFMDICEKAKELPPLLKEVYEDMKKSPEAYVDNLWGRKE